MKLSSNFITVVRTYQGSLVVSNFIRESSNILIFYTRNFPFIHFVSQNYGRFMISVLNWAIYTSIRVQRSTTRRDLLHFPGIKILVLDTQSKIFSWSLKVKSFELERSIIRSKRLKLRTRNNIFDPGIPRSDNDALSLSCFSDSAKYNVITAYWVRCAFASQTLLTSSSSSLAQSIERGKNPERKTRGRVFSFLLNGISEKGTVWSLQTLLNT